MKLVEVMACVDRIAKNGTNDSQGYKFVQAADVYDAVRGELAKRFVIPIPVVEHEEFFEVPTKSGGTMRYCTLRVRFDFTDAETGEVIAARIIGSGSDSGDKSPYKAMTGATKACLVNTFLIPTGDDPEKEERQAPPPPAGLSAIKSKLPKPTPPRQDEPPPPTDADAPGATPAHDRRLTFGFGNGKGVAIGQLDEPSLHWYLKCLQRDLADASKAKWHSKTREQMGHLEAELRLRAAQ